jgi:cytosine/uracil/thiamine/allantoin permease
VLTWIMAVSAIGALVSLVGGLVLVFVDRSVSPVFVISTLVSGGMAFVFWTLMRRVVRHKKILRSRVD